MIDIETMGTDIDRDDIIQIGILECNKAGNYWVPGKSYMRTLFTGQVPKDEWIATNHKDLLTICYDTPLAKPEEIRADILKFIRSCGEEGQFNVIGMNVVGFDLPFLVKKKMLVPPTTINTTRLGDYSYRVYEMRGAINLATDVLNVSDKELFKLAKEASPKLFELPAGKKHEALFDCYKQLQTLNGVIKLLEKK